jgi:hypothetical protein
LPKYLRELNAAAIGAYGGDLADAAKIRKLAARIGRNVGSIKSDSLRAAYAQLIDKTRAEAINPEALEKALWVAVLEKPRYVAERIARTEAACAWFDGYLADSAQDDDVWGFKWHLSSRHKYMPFDQCDVCANANWGFGRGVYPKKNLPSIPQHPHCMCMLEKVYTWEIEDEKFNPGGAKEYIDGLSQDEKQALFGVGGAKEYQQAGDLGNLMRELKFTGG